MKSHGQKQKQKQRQEQQQQQQQRQKPMRGFFPFDRLRVRMTQAFWVVRQFEK